MGVLHCYRRWRTAWSCPIQLCSVWLAGHASSKAAVHMALSCHGASHAAHAQEEQAKGQQLPTGLHQRATFVMQPCGAKPLALPPSAPCTLFRLRPVLGDCPVDFVQSLETILLFVLRSWKTWRPPWGHCPRASSSLATPSPRFTPATAQCWPACRATCWTRCAQARARSAQQNRPAGTYVWACCTVRPAQAQMCMT